MAQLSVPVKLRSSSSSTSSLSSTFSDLATSTSTTSSSPPNSKTNAFFASPFNTHPPSPNRPPIQQHPDKPRSITADFFATPVRPPSPPASANAHLSLSSIPASSIFPFRYTSSLSSPRRSRDFTTISPDDTIPHSYYPSPAYHSRTPSGGSDDLPVLFASPTSSTFSVPRLPTPPPRAHHRTLQREETIMPRDMGEPTPRAASREPMLKFERSLLFARQEQVHEAQDQVAGEEEEEDEIEHEDLKEGSIILLPARVSQSTTRAAPLPISPLALAFTLGPEDPISNDRGTPTPTPMDDATTSQEPSPQLRLLRPLGHGAFSAVWLAEDLSRVPLTLVSKKSVRDLRRKASGREKDRPSRHVERDNEWRLLMERAKTSDSVNPKCEFGEFDETPRPPAASTSFTTQMPAPTASAKESPKRQTGRLREGLRNMLAFSRGAANGVPPQASPVPPPLLGVDTAAMVVDGEPSPLSSGSSIHSADFSSLSRTSSLHSSSGAPEQLSRASSISVHRTPSIRGETSAHHGDADKAAALVRDASLRKFRARVRGTRPAIRLASGRACLDERDGEMGLMTGTNSSHRRMDKSEARIEGHSDSEYDSEKEVLQSSLSRKPSSNAGGNRLVAVKMTARRSSKVAGAVANSRVNANGKTDMRQHKIVKARREEDERTRVRFVREVEVLKHISHPNITPLLAHLSTATHHILVLPYLPGGDLLGLVNSDISWSKLTESVLRRVWVELCKAVGWMHGVGLVHRDIKLENILMTTPVFSALESASPPPQISSLPLVLAPFIQLTDFGLSRFVELKADGEAEPLSTRCGSEAYAAPELVTGGGVYDARKTDAWACGVVLYALVGRFLPFGEGVVTKDGGSRIGGERGEEIRQATPAERRHWLMRIAKGEWHWPLEEDDEQQASQSSASVNHAEELMGTCLVKSRGARRIVNRLLVRDTRKRARIADLWDDAWMSEEMLSLGEMEGPGAEKSEQHVANDEVVHVDDRRREPSQGYADQSETTPWDGDAPEFWKDALDVTFYNEPTWVEGFSDEHGGNAPLDDEEDGEVEDGCLLDQEGIDSITRQEVI